MKISFITFTLALLLSGILLVSDAHAQNVVVAPPAPGYNHGYHNGYHHGYRPYPPVYPSYPGYLPVYPGPTLPIYPSMPYQTQFPFYFGSNVNPYWMPNNFYYPQSVYVCSVRGTYSGLYYTGWGINPSIAQQYASYSCAMNEGSCVFFACIVR